MGTTRRAWTHGALAAAFVALPAAAGAQQTIEAQRPAAAEARVEIENLAGSIKVVGWEREEVAVSGRLGRGAGGLSFTGGPQRLRIEVETEGDPHAVRSDLTIQVPAAARLEIESFAASIDVSGVKGTLRAESVNGDISASGALREVEANVVTGDVTLNGAKGRIDIEAVNGDVILRGVGGELSATTVNGRLEVESDTLDSGQLEAVAGNVRFTGSLSPRATLDVETVSGDVELRLPASLGADFSVSTFSGEIVNELGPPATTTSKWTSEKELEFSVGSGGARIDVQTLSGQIALRKKP